MPRVLFTSGGQTRLASDVPEELPVGRADLASHLPTLDLGEMRFRSHTWWRINARANARSRARRVA
jgi:hypothetical protein